MGGSIPVGGEKGDFRQDSNAVCLCAEGWGGTQRPRGLGKMGRGWQPPRGEMEWVGSASHRRWRTEVETPSGCAGRFGVYSTAGDGLHSGVCKGIDGDRGVQQPVCAEGRGERYSPVRAPHPCAGHGHRRVRVTDPTVRGALPPI